MMGERIKQARLVAGLTQEALAQRLTAQQQPITKQALSKYELNKSTPPASIIMALAQSLNVAPSYFLADDQITIQWLAFRKHAQLPQAHQDEVKAYSQHVAEQQMWLTSLLYPNPSEHLRFPPSRVVCNEDEAEWTAQELRQIWGLDDHPIESVTQLLEDRGGVVVGISRPVDHFDGLSGWINDHVPLTVTSMAVSPDRLRFNLAHELGHLLLHCDDQDAKMNEKLAHRFAAAFLLPALALKRALGERRQHIEFAELGLLKQRFGISMQAIARRARDVGIIDEATCTRLFKDFSSRGWRKAEPVAFQGNEKPLRLKQMTLRAYAERVITRAQAEQLCPGCLADFPREEVQPMSARELMQRPLAERHAALEAFAEAYAEDYATNEELSEWTSFDDDTWNEDGEDWERDS